MTPRTIIKGMRGHSLLHSLPSHCLECKMEHERLSWGDWQRGWSSSRIKADCGLDDHDAAIWAQGYLPVGSFYVKGINMYLLCSVLLIITDICGDFYYFLLSPHITLWAMGYYIHFIERECDFTTVTQPVRGKKGFKPRIMAPIWAHAVDSLKIPNGF